MDITDEKITGTKQEIYALVEDDELKTIIKEVQKAIDQSQPFIFARGTTDKVITMVSAEYEDLDFITQTVKQLNDRAKMIQDAHDAE